MLVLYYQIKTPINFWCRQGLNHKSLIQLWEILPIKLTKTYNLFDNMIVGGEGIWILNISFERQGISINWPTKVLTKYMTLRSSQFEINYFMVQIKYYICKCGQPCIWNGLSIVTTFNTFTFQVFLWEEGIFLY